MILIRHYNEQDARATWKLFFHTVRKVNLRDYTEDEVKAWAPERFELARWQKRMNVIEPFIAELDGRVVGYADLQKDGLIDHFFCHHMHQGKGVGAALMNHIFSVGRAKGIKRFYSEVSITARPFYEHFGFEVIQQQEVEIRGKTLTNFLMEKTVQ
ncbi:putative Acyl-CoA N-acyltransferase [Vibrio nigripulchritudo SO65]|uniref:GNAT family N-acetyltransferase n=1 Tax=Vibrio nigripulchritudo TaxID=28173 RepID=UPI0003B1935F|nr:GNAT family N-acetyltransferase [Vibrio nigripulchritudo]CCN37260.1 putative Acyl-CoA N-acyltransferase [Vibrio nigripulchritudo AM115]CCN42354.1 putative Acyl-CoA N-acyltransferase [Vibrio nigripulchritudo FTn2]CCN67109.1 putative Acyl-CoA N-acyltransferase [Vibrio nigripulchritudo POn4]CCN79296.1 putative Acyl-CoA N-acyltransferase [Vibrio nigripulchritudo SO65]